MASPSSRLPRHLAIIMDGNGRWAHARGKARLEGHLEGARTVDRVVRLVQEAGIPWLTLYAFSAQNWSRPSAEVEGLMALLDDYLEKKCATLQENGIRLHAIGAIEELPARVQGRLEQVGKATAGGERMNLVLALSYGSREEILAAIRRLVGRVVAGELAPGEITAVDLEGALWTAGMPDPDLVVRTSGELRLSNFLLWQAAYAELHFVDVLWPDFDRPHLEQALAEYARRERRFGGLAEVG